MEYVCTGAVLKCTMGTSTTKLKATPKNVSLVGKDQANIADFVSMVNVPSFGRCRSLAYPPTAAATAANHGRLTPMPCVPGTCPFWTAVDRNSLVCGQPALLKAAKLSCTFGGIISIVSPGQNKEVKAGGISSKLDQKIPDELLQEFNSLETEGLDEGTVLDGIQLALDIAGMVPLWGAVADLLNASISVLRGDWVGAGLSLVSAVPGVGDAVGGAKLAYKGAKFAKLVSKSVSRNVDVSIKGLVKRGLSVDEAKAFRRSVRAERKNVARKFYEENTDWPSEVIEGHLRGIDYTKPVVVDTLPPLGQKEVTVYQYRKLLDDGLFEQSNYCTLDINAIPKELGTADVFSMNNASRIADGKFVQLALPFPKEKFVASISQPTPCLRSTSKGIYDDWSVKGSAIYLEGGALQYFIPKAHLENVIKL